MARIYQILLPLLSLFLVRVDLTDLFPLHLRVKLLKVYDGDTLLLEKGSYQIRLRISKIDAPEMGQPFLTNGKDAGLYSKKCLEKLIGVGEEYLLKIERYDIYKRVLGDLEGLSYRAIEEGCATLYPHAQFQNQKEKYFYLRALTKARSQRRGLWDLGGYKQPAKWRKLKKKNELRHWRQQGLK